MTFVRPIPVNRILVPATTDAAPDGFTSLRQTLDLGLPANLPLDAELSLALFVPTGDPVLWREATSDDSFADSSDGRAPRAANLAQDPVAQAPARLVLRQAGTNLAAMPLVVGARRRLPDDGGAVGALVEIVILDFLLNAGSMLGVGSFGSFIALAWRRADLGVSTFSLPPLDPRVAARFSGLFLSETGEP